MSKKSLFYKLGYRIGYWYAANKRVLHRQAAGVILHRIPGGRWLSKLF